MTLHLPKWIEELVERRANEAGDASAQAYVERLILEAEDRDLRKRADERGLPIDEYILSLPPDQQSCGRKMLEEMLVEGLESESILADDAFWAKKKADYIRRHQIQGQARA